MKKHEKLELKHTPYVDYRLFLAIHYASSKFRTRNMDRNVNSYCFS